jgi:hypothetical protein
MGVKKQTVSDIRKNKEKLIKFLLKYGLDTSSKGGFTVRDMKCEVGPKQEPRGSCIHVVCSTAVQWRCSS